jgi:hypothetical protein
MTIISLTLLEQKGCKILRDTLNNPRLRNNRLAIALKVELPHVSIACLFFVIILDNESRWQCVHIFENANEIVINTTKCHSTT